jgi:hypothetical protein
MSDSRLNHNTAFYGDYLIISGGHTLQNMIPREVAPAICYKIDSDDTKEYLTPSMGSSKLGMGLAMVGDERMLDKINFDSSNTKYSSTSFVSSDHSTYTTRSASNNNAQAFMSLFCP